MGIPARPSSVATHKVFRLNQAIKQLEFEMKTDPTKQSALNSLRERLAYWKKQQASAETR